MWADVDYDDDYSIDNDHDDFNEDEDDDDDDDEANNSCELAVPPSHIRNVWKAASGTLRGGGAKPKGEEQKKGNGNDADQWCWFTMITMTWVVREWTSF